MLMCVQTRVYETNLLQTSETYQNSKTPNKPPQSSQNKAAQAARRRRQFPATPTLGLLATRAVVDLPWVSRATMTPNATAYTFGADFTIRLNDIYQPGAGSLHAPYGFDQYSTFYRQYKVLSAHVKITIPPLSATDGSTFLGIRVVPPGYTASFSGNTLTQTLERPGSRVLTMSGGYKPSVTEFDVDFADLAGLTKQQFDADISEFGAAVTGSPNRIFALQMATADTTAAGGASQAIVEIRYRVAFWQRKTLAQS